MTPGKPVHGQEQQFTSTRADGALTHDIWPAPLEWDPAAADTAVAGDVLFVTDHDTKTRETARFVGGTGDRTTRVDHWTPLDVRERLLFVQTECGRHLPLSRPRRRPRLFRRRVPPNLMAPGVAAAKLFEARTSVFRPRVRLRRRWRSRPHPKDGLIRVLLTDATTGFVHPATGFPGDSGRRLPDGCRSDRRSRRRARRCYGDRWTHRLTCPPVGTVAPRSAAEESRHCSIDTRM